MQSSGGGSSRARLRYYRPASESEEDEERQDSEAEEDSDDEVAVPQPAAPAPPAAAVVAVATPASTSTGSSSALASAATSLRDNPVLLAGVAAGVAATGGLLLLLSVLGGKRGGSGKNKGDASGSEKGKSTGPGPNSKVKPSPSCVALSDGSAVVVHRPIAADNSCLFNAVGYCMHHSTNRAPYLRQVVSREVSSDPQHYSAAFLGMENPAYCQWITNPAHWGGGIELSILASHYRREIAAWNLATGACHVFGEDAGYTKRVMVIYNGVHYDALAISPGPKAAADADATEFNPRTKRGKAIIAAAQKLVQLHRRGKEGHDEKLDKQKQQERQQRKQKKQQKQQQQPASSSADSQQPQQQQQQAQQQQQQPATDSSSSSSKKEQPAQNGHASAAVAGRAAAAAASMGASEGSSINSSSSGVSNKLLGCKSCGEELAGFEAAKAHAAATGHVEFAEVQ